MAVVNIINKTIEDYKEQKIYIPEELINNNYQYYFDGDNIRIVTNRNCTQNYNSTYCDCYLYDKKNNITSEVYQCNTNVNNAKISYEKITNNIEYSNDIMDNYLLQSGIGLIMIILGILLALFLTKERSSY